MTGVQTCALPILFDEIWLPAAPFKGLTAEKLSGYRGPMYGLFESEFGVRMIRAEEKIRALAADAAIAEVLDQGKGISVREVSTKLHVDPSFVTTQTKSLEKHGFMRRVASKEDARVVLMSLTDKAHKQIANLYSQQVVADNLVFSDFSTQTFRDLTDKLATIKERLAKVARTIATNL